MIDKTYNFKILNKKMLAVGFWLLIWQAVSVGIGDDLIIVSPFSVIEKIGELLGDKSFYTAVLGTFSRLSLGYFLAVLLSFVLAPISARYSWIEELLEPLVITVKSVPVASFVILILIWIKSTNLAVFISLIMVFPVLYENLKQGIISTSPELLEMASVFDFSLIKKIRYIYIPNIIPYLRSALKISLGLCLKSGIAAEVIGLPQMSIGEKLYNAKIYLETGDLFAYTTVIIFISLAVEKSALALLNTLVNRLEREV